MLLKLAADVVVIIHLLWILFIAFGALLGRHVSWVKWLHGGALAFSVLLQVFGWICPLTYLEVGLRTRSDPELGYTGDFVAHYAEQLVYLNVSPQLVLIATLAIVGLSIWAYRPANRSAA